MGTLFTLIYLALVVLVIAGGWKMFVKAGKPGWAFLVPIYNVMIMLEIAGKPSWWIALILFVPIANLICLIIMYMAIAEQFGQSAGFGVGMALLGFIFIPILGFGSAQYQGAAAPAPAPAPPAQ
ncbi:MAG TPA: signal peptidase I [Phycisphaerae bacterium]|nr:signal peptidase I [Phycisphaerae bacterium]